MKRVILTGATSMLGIALVRECIEHNVEVIAIVRKKSTKIAFLPQSPLITVVEADLENLHEIPLTCTCDVFYHFAWNGTGRAMRDDPSIQLNNAQYALDAVEFARRLGCTAFIGAGSQAEYGIFADKIEPDTRVEPLSSYGICKYAAGKLTRQLCEKYGIRHIWTRIFSVYGEHDSDQTLIKYAIRQFREGKPAQFSAATQKWNYLYEKDAGKIFYLLGEKNVASGVYCVASEDTRPLKNFILEIREIVGGNSTCEFAPKNSAPMVTLDPDISKTVAAIGWRPKTTFAEGIIHMISDTSK